MNRLPLLTAIAAFALVAFASAVSPPTLHAQTPVTACGQTLHGDGVLTGDLDCSGYDGHAVSIVKAGTFNLAGFTLTQGKGYAVVCWVGCKVIGPGTIVGVPDGFEGIAATGSLKVRNLTITGTNGAVQASNNKSSGKAIVMDSIINDNDFGVFADSIEIVRSTISNSARWGASLTSCTRGRHLRTIDSTITGSGGAPTCGVVLACVDVASCRVPKLRNTTCDTSYVLGSGLPGQNWGLCGGD